MKTITQVSSSSITHCPDDLLSNVAKVGDIFVASEYGASVHSDREKHPVLSEFMTSPEVTRNEGFLLLRRVTSKTSVSDKTSRNCMQYETENIHPVEMLQSFDMKAEVSNPVALNYLHSMDPPTSRNLKSKLPYTPQCGTNTLYQSYANGITCAAMLVYMEGKIFFLSSRHLFILWV